MCGIVGVITTDNDTHKYTKEKFMTEGLYVDALRGWDPTGVMALGEEFRWEYLKNAVPAASFLDSKEWRKRNFNRWCMVGHNRAATVGKVTTENAHPFQHGDVMLVHNGTLRTTYDMPHKNKDIDVDSELIAYNLSQVEPEEAKDVLSKLQGAYALVWFDERDNSVNMARNSERPLHLAMNRGQDILYFMSDGHMLNMLTRRSQNMQAQPSGVFQIATKQILKYKKGSLVPEVTAVPNFTRVVSYRNQTHHSQQSSVATRGTRSGMMSTIPNDGVLGGQGKWDRLLIGGEYRIIPKIYGDMLKDWYGITLGEGLFFKPGGWMQWNWQNNENDHGNMYGKVFHKEWNAWVHARIPFVGRNQQRDYKNNTGWTVVPIGVDHTSVEGGKDELTLICRIVWYSWHDTVPEVTEDTKVLDTSRDDAKAIDKEVDEWLADDEEGEDSYEDVVKGPHGHYININAFESLTEDGCVMCSGPVFVEDCEDLVWVGEMENQPLCMGCLDYHTQATP